MGDWQHWKGSGMEELENVERHGKKAIKYAKKADDCQKEAIDLAQRGEVRFEPTIFVDFVLYLLHSNTYTQVDLARNQIENAKMYMSKARKELKNAETERSYVLEDLEKGPQDEDGDGLIDLEDSD